MILESTKREIDFNNTFKAKQMMSCIMIKLFVEDSMPCLAIEFNSKSLPVSWFITDSFGKVVLSGMCLDVYLNISLASLCDGSYTLRTKGEKYIFDI